MYGTYAQAEKVFLYRTTQYCIAYLNFQWYLIEDAVARDEGDAKNGQFERCSDEIAICDLVLSDPREHVVLSSNGPTSP